MSVQHESYSQNDVPPNIKNCLDIICEQLIKRDAYLFKIHHKYY